MKVIASTLLTLLAAPPSAIATNHRRRLGAAADVADIDNQSFSMDLIEGAAAEYDDDSNHHGKKVSIILTLIRVTCMNILSNISSHSCKSLIKRSRPSFL